MKILLLNAPSIKAIGVTGQQYPPLGILYLAAYAREQIKDVEFKAIDGYKEKDRDELVDKIVAYNPDIFGVSFTTQGATGAYYIIDEFKKRNKNALIVTGGPHPTIVPEESLRKTSADLVVVGEGEVTFLEIIRKKKNGEDIKGIEGTFHSENGEIINNGIRPVIKDLDTIPFPARDLIDITDYPGHLYKTRSLDTSMMSARGCPYNCLYCSNPVWKSQKPWYRLRSPKSVVDEMEFVLKEYGIKEFFDETDEFNGNMKWSKEVCDEIIKRNLDISWKAQMRVDHMDEELASKLKQSGFWMGLFGVESGNDKTLKGINKRQTIEQVDRALTILKKYNIKTFGLLMAFNVWEEEGKLCFEGKEDSMNTIRFAKKLLKEKKLNLISWSMTTPYPGSQLYDIAVRHNLIAKEDIGDWEKFDSSSNFVMTLPGVKQEDWLAVMNAGKRLQAKLLFTSGAFSFSAIPLYIKKLFLLIKGNITKRLGFA